MPTPAQLEKRQALCESLVRGGVQIVRDGLDHSDKASRCIDDTGKVVGYYCVLVNYDPATDRFNTGWNPIPSSHVEEIMTFDAVVQAVETVNAIPFA